MCTYKMYVLNKSNALTKHPVWSPDLYNTFKKYQLRLTEPQKVSSDRRNRMQPSKIKTSV
jgi:hypothetical protein